MGETLQVLEDGLEVTLVGLEPLVLFVGGLLCEVLACLTCGELVTYIIAVLAGTLWIVIASPIFAAGAPAAGGGLLRGAAVADGGGVLLIVLILATDAVSVWGAVKIYLIWMSVALAESALAAAAVKAATRTEMTIRPTKMPFSKSPWVS